MPRNFLVKRTKHSNAASYRERRNSGEDTNTNAREMNNEDLENIRTNFGSPDSGYSISPINLVMAPKDAENNNCDLNVKPSECLTFTPTKSPLTVSTNYPSPFYYSSFDKLCVSSNASPVYSPKGSPSQSSPNKRRGQSDNESKPKSIKKPKAVRKINFDEDKSSPVSGCIIKDVSDCEDGKVVYGDIDSSYNYVEVTPEARAAIEKIENKIGDYVCRLCKEQFEDAFKLAQHRCPRIVHVEYRCPECDKVFSCPANLASHRRWHKPRQNVTNKQAIPSRILPANVNLNHIGTVDNSKPLNLNKQILSLTAGDLRNSPSQDEGQYQCETCGKSFRRQAYLRKHVLNHANDQQTTRQYVEHQNNNITNINDCNICPSNGTSEKKPQNSDIFKCKYCASSFFSSPGLTRHINKCHPTENPQVILLQIPPSVNRPC